MRTKLKRLLALVMVFSMTMSLLSTTAWAASSAEYDYQRTDAYESTPFYLTATVTRSDGETASITDPAELLGITKDGKTYAAYCADAAMNFPYGNATKFKCINLEDSSYFPEDAKENIMAVLGEGYWHTWTATDLKNARTKSGISNLTRDQALAATQMAVWEFANADDNLTVTYRRDFGHACIPDPEDGWDFDTIEKNIKAYRAYLVNGVKNGTITKANKTQIPLFTNESFATAETVSSVGTSSGYDITVKFELATEVSEKDNLQLTAEITSGYKKTMELTSGTKSGTIVFENVPRDVLKKNSTVTLSISGTQKAEGYYFYEAQKRDSYDERYAGQNLVGWYSGLADVSASLKVDITLVDIDVTKEWKDNDDQDGIRPTEITVRLWADGECVDTLTLEGDNTDSKWKGSFTDLPKYRADGKTEIVYTITEDAVEDYKTAIDGYNVTNSYTPETTFVSGSKTWQDADNQDGLRPTSITINLLADGTKVDSETVTADDGWAWSFTDLPKYRDHGTEIVYTITEDEVDDYDTEIDGYDVTNTHTPAVVNPSVKKVWENAGNKDETQPDSITVQLTANGVSVGDPVTLSAENSWTYTWPDQDKYAGGVEIDYAVDEVNVPAGYTKSVTNKGTAYTITNVRTIVVEGSKTWNDKNDQDGKRPTSITINLLANGTEVDEKTVTAEDDWTWKFTDLPKYDANGTEIVYTITEDAVEHYTTSVNGYNVTNSYTPETIDINGSKTWEDAWDGKDDYDGLRPKSITINLLADGEKVGSKTVTADDGWAWSWLNLAKYKDGGTLIKYTITEDAVEGYETTITGYNVTNTHNVVKVSVEGSKTWNDANNQDGKRPTSITINLLANGTVKDSKTVTAKDGWAWSWTDLDKYANGKEIEYTITEDAVTGYTISYNGYNVTNTHEPETIDVSGTKTWDDANDQDGKRPTSITINLLADGKVKDSKTVTEDDDWAWSWTGLPKYANGKEIVYTITEDPVEDYETTIDGYNVINSYTPETTSVSGSKTWNDAENQDGKRPTSITINLLANGNKVDSTVVSADEDGNWTYEFTNLPKYANGEEIVYTIAEVEVEGYESVIDGYNVTNTHIPEKVSVEGQKTWVDNDDQDGLRPEKITINLLADGEKVDSAIVKADNDWKWSFTGLDKYKGGQEIKYTITEETVTGYETTVSGYNVTNTHKTAETEITVTKVWDDNNDRDGIRPASITVQLLADGADYGEPVTLSGNGNKWTYTWTKLPVKAAGKEITYTVEEVKVSGYSTAITGSAAEGFTITNKHIITETTISGEKTWNDANDQDGKRPESITIRLLADGSKVRSAEVKADEDGKWTYSFTGLPKYRDHGTEIAYTITEDAVSDYTTTVDGYNVTNSYTPGKTSVSVTKAWSDDGNRDGLRPSEIKVQLYANEKAHGEAVVLNAGNNWGYTWSDLDEKSAGKTIAYTVKELNVPEGYEATTAGSAETGYTITNTHDIKKINVSGKKTWNDANNQDGKRPDSITINLFADGELVESKTVTASDGWKWTFDNLPEKKDGEKITYTISEDTVPGYSSEVNGYNVTNSYTPGKTGVTVKKVWNDDGNRDGIRPASISVQLLADGTAKGETVTLNADNNWSYTWSDLDEMSGGQKVSYTVAELGEITGYTSVVNGYTITNIHDVEKTSVSGSKTWNDANNQDGKRPDSITINLFANGELVESKVVTAADGWKWSFTGLNKNENGKAINYTITENAVAGYETTVNGYDVTNTYTPGKTSISVNKVWVDDNDRDDLRPESISVQLLANGAAKGEPVVLSAENNWSHTWSGLDEKAAGQTISYTVEEVKVPAGYTKTISGDASTGYTITNSHGIVKTDISGVKTWNDNNDQDGKRPESITINLLADGMKVASKTVTAADGWKWTFEDLAVNDGGKKITYTITEDAVAGYTTTVDGYNVTNSYAPGKTSVSVTKAWNDDGNRDGIRPASVTVQLLADGAAKGEAVTLSAENGWTYTWSNLDEKAGGKAIVYTVTEVTVDRYTTVITGDASTGYTITNTHTPEIVDIKGSKTWNDNNDQDGKRPESITINLFANGEKVQSKTVTAADGWKWTFDNLPKNENGTPISYTITEDAVAGYSSEVNGYDVTNSYAPGKTSVSVTKAWNDDSNRDGIRPASVTVQLLANGTAKGEAVTLSAENGWTYTWSNLDEKAGGKTVTYTVEEIGVPEGYTVSVSGSASTGYTVTNTHETAKTSVDVEKVWKNTSNPPEVNVVVKLLADGEEVKTLTLNKDNGWKGTFSDLPVNQNGKAITYTVEEVKVSGYSTAITGSAAEGFAITNTKQSSGSNTTPASWSLTAKKTLNGQSADGYTFELLEDGKVLQTKTSQNGKIVFDEITYAEKEATYTYTVREVAGSDANIVYDASVYTVVVKVVKDGSSYLASASITLNGEKVDEVLFENKTTDQPDDGGDSDSASYTLTADKTLDGKKATGFTFEVKDESGTVVATASAKSGKITFPAFRFTAEGTYTYTVSEAAGTNSSVVYDDSVYTLTITVTKNGGDLVAACTGLMKDGQAVEAITFENTYDGERFYDDDEEELFEEDIPLGGLDAPETGDAGALWTMTAAASGLGLIGLNFFPKKRREDDEE